MARGMRVVAGAGGLAHQLGGGEEVQLLAGARGPDPLGELEHAVERRGAAFRVAHHEDVRARRHRAAAGPGDGGDLGQACGSATAGYPSRHGKSPRPDTWGAGPARRRRALRRRPRRAGAPPVRRRGKRRDLPRGEAAAHRRLSAGRDSAGVPGSRAAPAAIAALTPARSRRRGGRSRAPSGLAGNAEERPPGSGGAMSRDGRGAVRPWGAAAPGGAEADEAGDQQQRRRRHRHRRDLGHHRAVDAEAVVQPVVEQPDGQAVTASSSRMVTSWMLPFGSGRRRRARCA